MFTFLLFFYWYHESLKSSVIFSSLNRDARMGIHFSSIKTGNYPYQPKLLHWFKNKQIVMSTVFSQECLWKCNRPQSSSIVWGKVILKSQRGSSNPRENFKGWIWISNSRHHYSLGFGPKKSSIIFLFFLLLWCDSMLSPQFSELLRSW